MHAVESLLRSHELCRRIRRLAAKDVQRRSAGALGRILKDERRSIPVRVEAARALGRWDPVLALPILERLLLSADEISPLKLPLLDLVAAWDRPETVSVLVKVLEDADLELARSAEAALTALCRRGPAGRRRVVDALGRVASWAFWPWRPCAAQRLSDALQKRSDGPGLTPMPALTAERS
jgi:HEAT repeat protein